MSTRDLLLGVVIMRAGYTPASVSRGEYPYRLEIQAPRWNEMDQAPVCRYSDLFVFSRGGRIYCGRLGLQF